MALLQVRDLVKYYGATPILREVGLEIHPGEKWGLVGRNGSGKTTLFRVLTGIEEYDQGEVHWSQNCRIGYLQQNLEFKTEVTIYQELREIFVELDRLQAEIQQLQQQMEHSATPAEKLDGLIEQFHHLSEVYAQAGGYQIEGRIQGVLRGLGFPKERWHDQIAVLSGGERTRLALAKILLTDNDILFLDEPTNYLDLTAIEWLETYLAEYKGAVFLVSHDRFFLDKVISGIYEVEFCKLKRYKGNYTAYRQQKTEQYEIALKAYQQQEKEVAKLEKFVREARATEKSKRQAHSLEKRLDKLDRIEKPLQDQKSIKFQFSGHQASGRWVLEVDNLSKSFGNKTLLNKANFKLEAGEKIGFIGPNGTGKTTLLKIILGQESPDQGQVRLGYEVHPGYFSQLTQDEALTGTPFSQIMDAADLENTEARTILGRFLFRGDDVFKSVSDLSGGERRRLGLIKLMLSKANLLILDEPTNHLDLDSIEVIEDALMKFNGSMLIVSHDRYFLNKLVDRYLALVEGELIFFESYQAYLEWTNGNKNGTREVEKPKNEAQLQREQTKELQRQLRRAQRQLVETETTISELETKKAELMELLNDPEVHADYKKSLELSQELNDLEARLESLYLNWQELHEQVDELL